MKKFTLMMTELHFLPMNQGRRYVCMRDCSEITIYKQVFASRPSVLSESNFALFLACSFVQPSQVY